jgi:sarcosine oxidase subunit beta
MRPPELRDEYDVVIIGAGVLGLFTAYHLAQRMDPGRVLVLDKGFLSAGSSGRNGGGVRQQWESVATIRLAREAVATWRRFPIDFGYNPWFRQGGYVFLAFEGEEEDRLRSTHPRLRAEGLPVRWLGPREVRDLLPALDTSRVLGASYLRSDGVIFPFPVLWGLDRWLRRQGVTVRTRTEALGFETGPEGVRGVLTSAGRVRTPRVVNAAGGWSHEVSRRAGLDTANRPSRHEILATEPLKPFLNPMVVTLRQGLYFSQSLRGEIIGGLRLDGIAHVEQGLPSSSRFLVEMSRALTALVPRLQWVRVLRAWAGYYDDTPDGLPILGEDPRLPGFFQANGFGGHGFMLAPAAASRLARIIWKEPTDLDPRLFSPSRFLEGSPPPRQEGLQLG